MVFKSTHIARNLPRRGDPPRRKDMASLVKTISALEARREELTHKLTQINEQLATVAALLANQGTDKRHTGSPGQTRKPGAPQRASTRSRRAWFAREEATKLLRKAAKTAKAPADLVRALADLKGYSKTLSSEDMRRFQGAAFMAINQALKAGALKRRKDGAVFAR